jgi:hypothetical protein
MSTKLLNAEDLLIGSKALHEVKIPASILTPLAANGDDHGFVCMRPLSIAVLTLISRAARDDLSLIPLLIIKESVVEPALTLDQIRQMHVGLVHFLVSQANRISGLDANGATLDEAAGSPLGQTHILLAKHFGWTPDQVSQLTPGQVAVYLSGIESLLKFDSGNP